MWQTPITGKYELIKNYQEKMKYVLNWTFTCIFYKYVTKSVVSFKYYKELSNVYCSYNWI